MPFVHLPRPTEVAEITTPSLLVPVSYVVFVCTGSYNNLFPLYPPWLLVVVLVDRRFGMVWWTRWADGVLRWPASVGFKRLLMLHRLQQDLHLCPHVSWWMVPCRGHDRQANEAVLRESRFQTARPGD